MSKPKAITIVDEVQAAIARWPEHAARAGVSTTNVEQIRKYLSELECFS